MKNPIQWNRLQETSGGVVKAVIGNNLADNISATGYDYDDDGKFGKCGYFPQTYSSGVLSGSFTVGDMGTYVIFVKPNGWSTTNFVSSSGNHELMGYTGAVWPMLNIQIYTGTSYISFGTSGTDRRLYTSYTGGTISDGVWNSIIFDWNISGASYHLYVNNSSVTLGASTSGTPGLGTYTFYLCGSSGNGMKAWVDQFLVFDYVLSATDRLRVINSERGFMNDQY
jgi:hypothetical protein